MDVETWLMLDPLPHQPGGTMEGGGGLDRHEGHEAGVNNPHPVNHFDTRILGHQWPNYHLTALAWEGGEEEDKEDEAHRHVAPLSFRRYLGRSTKAGEADAVFWVFDIAALLLQENLLECLFSLEASYSSQDSLGISAVRATSSHLLLKVKARTDDHHSLGEAPLPSFHTSYQALEETALSRHPHLMLALLTLGIQLGYNASTSEIELVADGPIMRHRSKLYANLWTTILAKRLGPWDDDDHHEEEEQRLGLLGATAALCSLGCISLEIESQVVRSLVQSPPGSQAPRQLRTLTRLLKDKIGREDMQSLLGGIFPSLFTAPKQTRRGMKEEEVIIWVACRHPPSRCPPETMRHPLRAAKSLLMELRYFCKLLRGPRPSGRPWEVDLTCLDGDAVERALNYLHDGILLDDVALGASGPQSVGLLMEVAHVWGATDLMNSCCHVVEKRVKGVAASSRMGSASLTHRRDLALGVLQLFDALTVAGVENGRDICLDFIVTNYHECCQACEPDSPSLPLPLAMRSKRRGRGLTLDHFSASPMALAVINRRRLQVGLLPEPERFPDKCPSLTRILEEDMTSLRTYPIPGVEILPPFTLTGDATNSPPSSSHLSRRLLPAPFLVRLSGPALESTPWAGLQLIAKFRVSTAYPRESPRVSFIIVPVLHPNVEPSKGLIFPETLDHIEGQEGSSCLPSLRVVLQYLVRLLANPTLAPDRVVDPVATELVFGGEEMSRWSMPARKAAEKGRVEAADGLRKRVALLKKKIPLSGQDKQTLSNLLQCGTALDIYQGNKLLDQIELRWEMEKTEGEDGSEGGVPHQECKRQRATRSMTKAMASTTDTTKRRPPAAPGTPVKGQHVMSTSLTRGE